MPISTKLMVQVMPSVLTLTLWAREAETAGDQTLHILQTQFAVGSGTQAASRSERAGRRKATEQAVIIEYN